MADGPLFWIMLFPLHISAMLCHFTSIQFRSTYGPTPHSHVMLYIYASHIHIIFTIHVLLLPSSISISCCAHESCSTGSPLYAALEPLSKLSGHPHLISYFRGFNFGRIPILKHLLLWEFLFRMFCIHANAFPTGI
jgi:hypothetical protein